MTPLRFWLGVALAGAVAGCAHDGPAFNTPPSDVKVVEMHTTLRFSPETLTISRGQTVQWSNKAIMTHTVAFDPSKVKDPADVSLPAGVTPFTSGEVMSGQTWTHKFTVPGTYHYVCQPHEGLGMKGTIIVQ